MTKTNITDLQLYRSMLAEERAIVFFHAAWSGYAFDARENFERLRELETSRGKVGLDTTWWEIDLTEQSGVIWDATWKWLEPQCSNASTLIWGGWGSVVWSTKGSIVRSLVRPEQLIVLIEQNRGAFD